jgi:thymidylate kinase
MKSIVFDGHDCSGKSSLAKLFVESNLNAVYIRPFEKNIGELFWWLYTKKEYVLANELALNSVKRAEEENIGKLLVFDRHWLTLFSILPEDYWEVWHPLPETILCWADPVNTNIRMKERGEKELFDGYNEYYCNYYLELAKKFGIKVVNTSNKALEKALGEIMLYIQSKNDNYKGESTYV